MSKENFLVCKVCSSKIMIVNLNYELAECRNCGLIFCVKYFSEEEIVKVYDDLYNTTLQYASHQIESKRLLNGRFVKIGRNRERFMKNILKMNVKDIVEIGAGVGIIGNWLKAYNVKYTGIELDEKTASKARATGLNVISGSFEELRNCPNQFDSVFLTEVLEHLQDLKLFFELAAGALKDGGVLCFTVPNYNKILNYNRDEKNIHQDIPPIHLNFFTEENLPKVLSIAGFKVVRLYKKRLPYLNFRKSETYKFLISAAFGSYEGPTIYCIAKKV